MLTVKIEINGALLSVLNIVNVTDHKTQPNPAMGDYYYEYYEHGVPLVTGKISNHNRKHGAATLVMQVLQDIDKRRPL